MNLLARLQMHLSIGSRVFVFTTDKLPIVNNGNTSGRTPSSPQICRIHVTSDVTVPPRSMRVIEGKLDGVILPGTVGLIESARGKGLKRFWIGCGRVFGRSTRR